MGGDSLTRRGTKTRTGHEKQLLGLRGIVRISRTTLNGRSFLNLGGLAPASKWEEFSVSAASSQEVARDDYLRAGFEISTLSEELPLSVSGRLEGEGVSGDVLRPVFLRRLCCIFRAQDARIGFNSSSADYLRAITGFL
jgi:hypothetical protein